MEGIDGAMVELTRPYPEMEELVSGHEDSQELRRKAAMVQWRA